MKKRPFLLLSGAFVFGEVCCYMNPAAAAAAIVVLTCLSAVYGLFFPAARSGISACAGRNVWLLLPVLAAAGIFRMDAAACWSPFAARMMENGGPEKVRIVFRIDEIRRTGGSLQFYTRTISEITERDSDASVPGETLYGAVAALKGDEEAAQNIQIGDMIQGEGTFTLYDAAANFGQFDLRAYYKARGLEGRIRLDSFRHIPALGMRYTLARLTDKGTCFLRERLSMAAGEDAGLLTAILTGDQSGISDEDQKLFQESGISHMYAVSGLHVSLAGWGLYGFLKKLGVSQNICSAGACIGLWLLTEAAGGGVSVKRAFYMFLLSLLAGLAGRTYDLPVSLSAACMLILWERPLMLAQSGFQLSFCAVAGIAAAAGTADRKRKMAEEKGRETEQKKGGKWRKKGEDFLRGMTVSLWIQLTMLPAVLWNFFQYPFYGIILNMIVIPMLSVVLFLGFFAMMLSCVWISGARICLWPVHLSFCLWRFLCKTACSLPGALWVTGRPDEISLGFFCIFLFGFWVYSCRKKWGSCRFYPACLFLTLIVSLLFLSRRPESGLQVTFLDVGQGDGIYIQEERGYTMMIDGGSSDVRRVGETRILPLIKASGSGQIDDWFLSHPDNDHLSGLKELLSAGFPVKRLWMPHLFRENETAMELKILAEKNGTDVLFTQPGLLIFDGGPGNQAGEENADGGPGFRLICLYPESDEPAASVNDGSMVLLLQYDGIRFLFTGDLETPGEARLLAHSETQLSCHILKTGHHGSQSSTSQPFLEATDPLLAVISCGRDNSYGHPHPQLLSRLKEQGCQTVSTMDAGAVVFQIHNGKICQQR